jgi:hypothetical protein
LTHSKPKYPRNKLPLDTRGEEWKPPYLQQYSPKRLLPTLSRLQKAGISLPKISVSHSEVLGMQKIKFTLNSGI